MCGRTVYSLPPSRLGRVAGIALSDVAIGQLHFRNYNLCPTNSLVCIIENSSLHCRSVQLMKWGLEPRFPVTHTLSTINARIEGLSTSKLYGPLVDHNRCVVVVDGFYEWHQEKTEKVPFLLRYGADVPERSIPGGVFDDYVSVDDFDSECVLPAGVSPLLLAGIYDRSPSGDYTCSIITTDSVGPCSQIHSRMPLLLSPESAADWLSVSLSFNDMQLKVFQTSRELAAHIESIQVSSLVNSVMNSSKDVTLAASEMKKKSFEKGLGRFFKTQH